MSVKQEKRARRQKKIRSKIHGTKERPRLCVFRSQNHIYARLIDDAESKVLLSVSDMEIKSAKKSAKSESAKEVGKLIAKKALEKKIEKVVFDRAGFVFHGRIKALAEGAREGGLKF
ncbi:MAG: 50S ribosomal protein L18 [Candidatus Staskawiczbacteria bacterium RIFOXYC1_FULL_37_43]|nr:MAG: 50S ribosomal protein L18 [Candidatus Staskawiczbacteria bacterium RIFCSPHIGHO2_01_FULL_37_17]OGZ72024.1 MAG: 50S ribosomal protein L18 [Candidatus Staskawiczbacteria bacterium RIFCSPLOWO2_01_FULL_37_19]OGZ75810.1 MAG: 50S ribosomal protein L18 [Candidatus Staskawiczbacteria bacterium RIFOXYA1_FULL_37_15]OGZ76771.1 MAG: 50S ribosomal protein L18 [Candidatus Staskawiczbacteria bacterium RIFOXYA12_FULL_37_10]OGZ80700.1 MAG: 50S ribosomal protein L18 [Candidatus Staskawiczbacteria bacteriu